MCFAMTGEVLSVDASGALVQLGDRTRWVSTTLVPEIAPGDLVLVSALSVVQRLTVEEACELAELALLAQEG
jgi:hydrogenase maturation factor